MKQCTLCIPTSAVKVAQMKLNEMSNKANIFIYVEQVTGRLKDFRKLKLQQPLLHFPIMNNILYICAALASVRRPLTS